MSGRYEMETKVDERMKDKLKKLPPIVTDYYYSLIGSGKSYLTAQSYVDYVTLFIKYLYRGKCPDDFYKDVRPTDVSKYIASLRTKKVNGKTERTSDSHRAVHWSALKSFFKFLVPEYISSNPVADTERPRVKDNPQVTYLEPEEISTILEYVDKTARKMIKNRDLCILKLGFSTGLRVSAIVGIDVRDVDLIHNRIRVTEKGDYDNYVNIGNNLKQQIRLWLQDRDKYFDGVKTNALFVSQKKNRMSVDAVWEMIKKYTKDVTDKNITPHVMRHSCATNLYEKTGDIYLCASQLNHKNVTTTQRYAEISKAKQEKATSILDDMI